VEILATPVSSCLAPVTIEYRKQSIAFLVEKVVMDTMRILPTSTLKWGATSMVRRHLLLRSSATPTEKYFETLGGIGDADGVVMMKKISKDALLCSETVHNERGEAPTFCVLRYFPR
jgi:hypothetical protein